jgi:hypothetical protein
MDHGESGSMSTNDGPNLPEDYDAADVVRKIMHGEEQIVSYDGSSQYAAQGAGSSACGIAALNCARVFFKKEHEGLRDESLLKAMIARDTTDVGTLAVILPTYATTHSVITLLGDHINMCSVAKQTPP